MDVPVARDIVPDLKEPIAHDPKADPPDKYKVLEDAQEWTTNVGYPGYGNAATGEATPEEAIKEAEAKSKQVFAKWKEKGLV